MSISYAVAACSRVFRGISAPASLKRHIPGWPLQPPGVVFRGISAPASLKPRSRRHRDIGGLGVFRGISAPSLCNALILCIMFHLFKVASSSRFAWLGKGERIQPNGCPFSLEVGQNCWPDVGQYTWPLTPVGMNRTTTSAYGRLSSVPHACGDEPASDFDPVAHRRTPFKTRLNFPVIYARLLPRSFPPLPADENRLERVSRVLDTRRRNAVSLNCVVTAGP